MRFDGLLLLHVPAGEGISVEQVRKTAFKDDGAALFDDRLTQIDLRLTRLFRIGGGRIQGIAELYNVTNTRPSQANVTTYGAAWLQPTSILGGRLFKVGTQIDF